VVRSNGLFVTNHNLFPFKSMKYCKLVSLLCYFKEFGAWNGWFGWDIGVSQHCMAGYAHALQVHCRATMYEIIIDRIRLELLPPNSVPGIMSCSKLFPKITRLCEAQKYARDAALVIFNVLSLALVNFVVSIPKSPI